MSFKPKIEEASLTGESVPTENAAVIAAKDKDKDVPLGDRHNMAYMGTNVVYGRGEGVVVNTGMQNRNGENSKYYFQHGRGENSASEKFRIK